MFGAILKVTNISFQKGVTFCHSIYVKKVMKLHAFIFEQPSCKIEKYSLQFFKVKTQLKIKHSTDSEEGIWYSVTSCLFC